MILTIRRGCASLPRDWITDLPKSLLLDFDEACLVFSLDTAREEASGCFQCSESHGCVLACPLHNDIPTAMWEVSQGNFFEAAAILRETSDFLEFCGRLTSDECLCAGSCGMGKFHPDVRLGWLDAFVVDFQREVEGGIHIPEFLPPTGKRVAVVGSGSADLTADRVRGLGVSRQRDKADKPPRCLRRWR